MKRIAGLAALALVVAAATVQAQEGTAKKAPQAPTEVSAAHILIQYKGSARAPESITRSKEEALDLARKVAEMARAKDADFGALAEKFSDGPTASRGGKLGNFRPQQMVKPFSDAVLALEIGEVSDPVETQFGYHVIKRLEVVEPKKASAKHILIMYKGSMRAPASVTRTKEEARELAELILKRIREGEKFEELAKQFSDGPTGPRGGDLGEFPEGVMHPNFEKATFACKVGEVSDIVETPFGYHIIYRYK